MALRKLLIRTWFGPPPDWTAQWRANVRRLGEHGFDFLLVNVYEWFAERCRERLGIEIAPLNEIAGTRKAGDFDPTYGVLFIPELEGYDFWGHCALDAVYGKVERFVTDELLEGVDIFANDPNMICGPFTLYRNMPVVNDLFRRVAGWEKLLSDATMYGFDEIQFNAVVQQAARRGDIRFKGAFWQAHDCQEGHVPTPRVRLLPDGSLMDDAAGCETMMFHFHRYRQWPIGASS